MQNRDQSPVELQSTDVGIEIVLDDATTPYGVNFHTHGLAELSHLDFQVVYPIPQEDACAVLAAAVNLVEQGFRFESGDTSPRILADGVMVKFLEVAETGRRVLRIIVPDEDYQLDQSDMDPEYARQYLEEGPPREQAISLEDFEAGLIEAAADYADRLKQAGILEKIEPEWRKDLIEYAKDNGLPSSAFTAMHFAHCESDMKPAGTFIGQALDIHSQYVDDCIQEISERTRQLKIKLGFREEE